MLRVLWLAVTLAAITAALMIGVPTGAGAQMVCPNNTIQYTLTGVSDPFAVYDKNGDGIVCEADSTKIGHTVRVVDDNPPRK
jgi:hypothetical protein